MGNYVNEILNVQYNILSYVKDNIEVMKKDINELKN